jgi:hypothetical protein
MIVAEALCSGNDNLSKSALAQRVAILLGDNFEKRQDIFESFSDLYDERSYVWGSRSWGRKDHVRRRLFRDRSTLCERFAPVVPRQTDQLRWTRSHTEELRTEDQAESFGSRIPRIKLIKLFPARPPSYRYILSSRSDFFSANSSSSTTPWSWRVFNFSSCSNGSGSELST